MNEFSPSNTTDKWFSTYGIITVQRILGHYHLFVPIEELTTVCVNTLRFYHGLLQVPLKNIATGMIFQQARDYQVYSQKLLIDFLLSGKRSSEEFTESVTHDSLEEERVRLMALGEEFNQYELIYKTLIAESQAYFIQLTKKWHTILHKTLLQVDEFLQDHQQDYDKEKFQRGAFCIALIKAMEQNPSQENAFLFANKVLQYAKVSWDDQEKINTLAAYFLNFLNEVAKTHSLTMNFFTKAQEINDTVRAYRMQFQQTIIRVNDLLKQIPDYRIDPIQDGINRELLYFDANS